MNRFVGLKCAMTRGSICEEDWRSKFLGSNIQGSDVSKIQSILYPSEIINSY